MPVEGEREIEDFLSGANALTNRDPVTQEQRPPEGEPEETPDDLVVHDERPGYEPPPEDGAETPPLGTEPLPSEEGEETEETEPPDDREPHIAWAEQKYGTDTDRWARALYEQEQFIGRLSAEKKQAEEHAGEAIRYAQQVEQQAQTGPVGMPLSAQEEAWVEQAMGNPAGAAYQAARSGNVQLYNAVIEAAAENFGAGVAANIGTQVTLALRDDAARSAAAAAPQNGASPQPGGDLQKDLGESFQRLGIDVQRYGQQMWEKVEELGEYDPYVQAIMGGDAHSRDLAMKAVYDLVRAGTTTTRKVVDEQREEQIRREGELRRETASVVTGSPHVSPPPAQSPLMDAMEQEWRRAGQWHDPE